MTPAELRERALALQAWLDSVAADVPWPPHLQAIIDRCRDDLALALASTDPETATLLEGIGVEDLRGVARVAAAAVGHIPTRHGS